MAKSYLDIQNSAYKVGNIMDWTNALTRLSGVPVDITEVYDSFDKAVVYAATNPVAYEGQLITVTENGDTTVYVITPSEQGTHKVIEKVDNVDTEVEYSIYIKKVGTVPTGDDASITVTEDGRVALKGFANAEDAYLPRVKVTNGVRSIEWVPINQIVEGDTNTVTKVEVAEGSALSIEKDEDVNTDTVTYTLDVAIPEYAVKKTTGTGVVNYELTKDGIAVAEQIVVPNAYNDSALVERVEDVEALAAGNKDVLDNAVEDISDHEDRLEAIEAFFDGAAADEGEGESLKNALDTLVEIQTFINTEGETAKDLLDAINENTEDIAALQKTLATNGDFEKRVAEVEAKASNNTSDIEALQELTTTSGAIYTAINAAKDQADKGVADAATAQAAANAADAKAVNAQKEVDALETEVAGIKTTAEDANALAIANDGRLDTAEANIDALEAIVKTGANTNAALREAITELQGIVKTGDDANSALRTDLTNLGKDLSDLATAINDENSGLAKTNEIADNAASLAAENAGRLDTAEADIDVLQEIVDSGDGKTIRNDITALQQLTGDGSKGNNALYTEISRVAGLVDNKTAGLSATKAIADNAASEASDAHSRLDDIDTILTGYEDINVKDDVNDARNAAYTADGKAVAAQNAADAAQGTANAVKAAVEDAATGLAKTKEVADAAAAKAAENAGRLDTAADAIEDLESIVLDPDSVGNEKLRADLDAITGSVNNASTGLAKTKEIADNAAAAASANSDRLDAIEGDCVKIGTDNKLYHGKDGDVIIFYCGSATENID